MTTGTWPAIGRLIADERVELGTCFAISDGLALTAAHCLEDRIAVGAHAVFNETVLPVTVVDHDPELDVAVLRFEGRLPGGAQPFALLDGLPREGLPWRVTGFTQDRLSLGPVTIDGEVSQVAAGPGAVTEIQLTSRQVGDRIPAAGFSGGPVQADVTTRMPVAFAIVRRGIPDPTDDRLRLGGLVYAVPASAILARWPLRDEHGVRLSRHAADPLGWPERMEQLPEAARDAVMALSCFGTDAVPEDAAVAALGAEGDVTEALLVRLRRDGLVVDRDGGLALATGLPTYLREHHGPTAIDALAWSRVATWVSSRLLDAARLLGVTKWVPLAMSDPPGLADLPSVYLWLRRHLDLAFEAVRRLVTSDATSAWDATVALAVCLMSEPGATSRRRDMIVLLAATADASDAHRRAVAVLAASQLEQAEGRHDEVLATMSALASELDAKGDELGAAICRTVGAVSHGSKGEWSEALALVEPAVDSLRTMDDPLALAHALVWLGYARTGSGQAEAGTRTVEEAKELCLANGHKPLLASILVTLAEERLRQGRPGLETGALADMSLLFRSLVPVDVTGAGTAPGGVTDSPTATGRLEWSATAEQDPTVLDAEGLLTTAATLASELGARQLEIAALTTLARLSADLGEYSKARERQERLVRMMGEMGDRVGRAGALVSLAVIETFAQRLRAAGSALQEAGPVISDGSDVRAAAHFRFASAQLALALGQAGRAAEHARAALSDYDRLGDPIWRRTCEAFLGLARQAQGDRGGIGLIEAASDDAARHGALRQSGDLAVWQGWALAGAGELLSAGAAFDRAADRLADAGEHRHQAYAWANAGRTRVLLGDHHGGLHLGERALARFVALHDEAGATTALAMLAGARTAAFDLAGAADAVSAARESADRRDDYRGELELSRVEAAICSANLNSRRAAAVLTRALWAPSADNDVAEAMVMLEIAAAEQAQGRVASATEYVEHVQRWAREILHPAWFADTAPRLHHLAIQRGEVVGEADELDAFLAPVARLGAPADAALDDALIAGYAARGLLTLADELAGRAADARGGKSSPAVHRALAGAATMVGRPLRARSEWRAVAAANAGEADELRAWDLIRLGSAEVGSYAIASGVEVLTGALRLAEDLHHPACRIQANRALYLGLRPRGLADQALEHLAKAEALAAAFGNEPWRVQLAIDRAHWAETTDLVLAQLWFADAARRAERSGLLLFQVTCMAELARVEARLRGPSGPGSATPPVAPPDAAVPADALLSLLAQIHDPLPRAGAQVGVASTWVGIAAPSVVHGLLSDAADAAAPDRRTWAQTRCTSAFVLLRLGLVGPAAEAATGAVAATAQITDLVPLNVASLLVRARARFGLGDQGWADDVVAASETAALLVDPLEQANQAVQVVAAAFDLLGDQSAVRADWARSLATSAERLCREAGWVEGRAVVLRRIGVGLATGGQPQSQQILAESRAILLASGNDATVWSTDWAVGGAPPSGPGSSTGRT